MELLQRLYKIATSRVPRLEKGDEPVEPDPSSSAAEDRGTRAKQQQHRPGNSGTGTQSQHSHRPGQDPQLAAYYANLEIPYGSDLEQVRRAWKHLVRRYHPDLHSADPEKRRVANELTQGLNHAYEELKKRLDQSP